MATRRPQPEQPVTNRRRRYLVRGRRRVPFEGHQRLTQPSGANDDEPVSLFGAGLTPAQVGRAEECLALAVQRRRETGCPLKGPWWAAIIAGVVSAVKNGRVGNSRWGWSMHGKRGGHAMARHALYKLREISPKGACASVIARSRRKAREVFEQDCARGVPLPPMNGTSAKQATSLAP